MPTHILSEAEAKKEYMRQWRLDNAERLREWQREYDKNRRPERVRSEEQKERDRACNRRYMKNRLANDPVFREKERVSTAKRVPAWRAANPDKVQAYNEIRREKERGPNREHMREVRKNPVRRERLLQATREWRLKPSSKQIMRENRRIASHRRRAHLRKVENTFTRKDWQTLLSHSKHCHWCKTPFTAALRPTHDHVIPLAKGGANTLANSCCACRPCNVRKNAGSHNPITGQLILL
jgi:hypothetical protein